jgi:hypothetical protein
MGKNGAGLRVGESKLRHEIQYHGADAMFRGRLRSL